MHIETKVWLHQLLSIVSILQHETLTSKCQAPQHGLHQKCERLTATHMYKWKPNMDVGGKAGGKLQLTNLGSCLTLPKISILYGYNCYLTVLKPMRITSKNCSVWR